MATPETPEKGLHPRNLHRGRYDFDLLLQALPELKAHVIQSPEGEPTVDFASPAAVKALNHALLVAHYGIKLWDIPKGYLCPPVPGRADYLHHAADLLASDHGGKIPEGPKVRVLDIGIGANCVFPIIGRHVYGWRFVGADIDPLSVTTAQHIAKFNPNLGDAVEVRLQRNKHAIFHGIWKPNERFHLTLCNPPFHSSKADADAKTQRKLRNLGRAAKGEVVRNFGGQKAELFVDGGELAFVKRIVAESRDFAVQCMWFTSVVSKSENLKPLQHALRQAEAVEARVLASQQGQKASRILCWTYLDGKQRAAFLAPPSSR